jgi:hypothetical protein
VRSVTLTVVSLLISSVVACSRTPVSRSVRGSSVNSFASRQEYYRDDDEKTVLEYGHAANAADEHAVATLVADYYMAGAAGDGAMACALTAPAYAAAVPEQYGQDLGANAPSDTATLLSGASTCPAVLDRLLKRLRPELVAPVMVTEVRVKGNYAYAFVGSATIKAGFIEVVREAGVWKIDGLLGRPLP